MMKQPDSMLRKNSERIAELLSDPDRVIKPVCADEVFFAPETDNPSQQLGPEVVAGLPDKSERYIFLGMLDDVPHFAFRVKPDEKPLVETKELQFASMRGLLRYIDSQETELLLRAKALAFWHETHQHCGRCGALTYAFEAGHARKCSNISCGASHFPRTDPAVIVAIEHEDKLLMGRQASWGPIGFSVIAGFVDPGESLEQAVIREAMEETGVEVTKIRYARSQPWPFPASIMLGFFATAKNARLNLNDQELAEARWFSREAIVEQVTAGQLRLPFRYSIAYSLVQEWFDSDSPGALEELLKEAGENARPETSHRA